MRGWRVTRKDLPVRAGIRSRRINVDYLARVEGEGALLVDIADGELRDVQLRIFEPPRFFEALLAGRRYTEVPDITARVCGICPVAYMMSAAHALENMLGVEVEEGIRRLRRLLYCGEWIESHVLHIYLLHAPDFLGFDDAMSMAAKHREAVTRGLRMKKAGNAIVTLLGGREIHPVNVRVGGFYKIPPAAAFRKQLDELKWARDAAADTVAWVAGLEFPEHQRDYEFVALRHERDYPFSEGRIVSSAGLDIGMQEYPAHFQELQLRHSTALHSLRKPANTPYFVGPMARFNLNRDRLSKATRQLAAAHGFDRLVSNPFESIVVRALETHQAFDEAIALIEDFLEPAQAAAVLPARGGVAMAATEAPRGLLFHRYEVDEEGFVRHANIIPPTSQNQSTIEDDLRAVVSANLELSDEKLTWRCEQAIRNYDPCISCATHFLTLQRCDLSEP
jgi:coenzyme F420-reducing hydrogenase alpha subunit